MQCTCVYFIIYIYIFMRACFFSSKEQQMHTHASLSVTSGISVGELASGVRDGGGEKEASAPGANSRGETLRNSRHGSGEGLWTRAAEPRFAGNCFAATFEASEARPSFLLLWPLFFSFFFFFRSSGVLEVATWRSGDG